MRTTKLEEEVFAFENEVAALEKAVGRLEPEEVSALSKSFDKLLGATYDVLFLLRNEENAAKKDVAAFFADDMEALDAIIQYFDNGYMTMVDVVESVNKDNNRRAAAARRAAKKAKR
jgi:hypothetical protein